MEWFVHGNESARSLEQDRKRGLDHASARSQRGHARDLGGLGLPAQPRTRQGNLLLLCIDGKTGKIRWQQTVARGNYIKGKNDLASPSAVTDGKRVVVVFGTGDLAAYDFEGKQLWSRNLAKQYGKLAPKWLYGSSPLLYRDKLYIEDLQEAATLTVGGSFLLCLDPQTGKELWRQVRKTDARAESQDAYTSPIVRPTGHGAEIVVYGADYLTSHDPDTGAELWRSPSLNARKAQNWRAVASPVVGPEGIFACLPQGFGPLVALRITGTGPGGPVEPAPGRPQPSRGRTPMPRRTCPRRFIIKASSSCSTARGRS